MTQNIQEYLDTVELEMFDLLQKVVEVNSYSGNPEGVSRVADIFEAVLKEMGFATRRQSHDTTGDNLIAENPARHNGGGVLLIGHMDTVFPPDMGFDTYRRSGDMVYGPGVSDMKGGLVAGIYALKALDHAGLLKDIPAAFVFNSDEEIGSPNSRDVIVEEAQKSDFCFVMEGSGAGGEIVIARKGRIVFDLEVTGKAGHAGHTPHPKPSATVELAHKITALEALNDPEAGTTVNIGLIEGGVGPNTVPAKAKARVETRFTSFEGRDAVWAAIEKIAATSTIDGTSGALTIEIKRPPMVANDTNMALYGVVEQAADDLDMTVSANHRGGGSDANTVSEAGIPVLDGLGPAGGNLHTPEEYMLAPSLKKQTLLTAASILKAIARP